MSYVTTDDDTRLFCRSWGAGPPVVFCHGWAMNADIWQPAMLALAEAGFRTIAYDRRGHGRSDDSGQAYDFDTLADDLGAVLEGFDVQNATLVGHSMGNGEIVRYLSRYLGARASRVVMVAPALPYPLRGPDNPEGAGDPEQLAAMRAAIATDFAGFLAAAAPPAFGPESSAAHVDHAIRMMLQTTVRAAIQTNITTSETDLRAEVAAVTLPTLILHGDADQLCPLEATSRRVARMIRGSRLKVYPGAMHTMVSSHAKEIAADIAAFATEPAAVRAA